MRKLRICLSILYILIILIIVYVSFHNHKEQNGISMKEAYHIAYQAVYEKNENALLVFINSTDSNKHPEDKSAGNNGLRRYWNLYFAVPESNSEHWIVTIRDRKIQDFVKVNDYAFQKNELIHISELRMDSKEALQIAQNTYYLEPGEGWAIGYHFSLRKEEGIATVCVYGRDKSKGFARVYLNAGSKKVISAYHKVPNSDGRYQWENYNE